MIKQREDTKKPNSSFTEIQLIVLIANLSFICGEKKKKTGDGSKDKSLQ